MIPNPGFGTSPLPEPGLLYQVSLMERVATVNGSQRPREGQEGLSRWEEVLFPSYRIRKPSATSDALPRWIQRMREQGQAKDLTGYLRGESNDR